MHKESLFTKNRERPSCDKLTPCSIAPTGAPSLHLVWDKIGHSAGGVGCEEDQYGNYMEIY